MSQENSTAKKLIEALAGVNRLLRDHSVELRRLPRVRKAQTSPVEAVVFASGPGLEAHVEAVLQDGDVACWWLYVRSTGDSWTVEASLDIKFADGQEVEKELPPKAASDFDDFLKILRQVANELLTLTVDAVATNSGR